jgi:hypothetical protein
MQIQCYQSYQIQDWQYCGGSTVFCCCASEREKIQNNHYIACTYSAWQHTS